MSTILSEPEILIDDSPFEPARFSVEAYHRLIDSDAFTGDERFELLEGVVVAKMNKNPPHVVSSSRTDRRLLAVLPAGWHLRRQDPLTLGDSEPEPDFAITRGIPENYLDRHPSGNDVGLACEVSDTSLRKDRLKARIYGKAGIPYYWIINLEDRCIECFSDPETKGRRSNYRTVRRYLETETIPLILDGVTVAQFAVNDLLPPAAAE